MYKRVGVSHTTLNTKCMSCHSQQDSETRRAGTGTTVTSEPGVLSGVSGIPSVVYSGLTGRCIPNNEKTELLNDDVKIDV